MLYAQITIKLGTSGLRRLLLFMKNSLKVGGRGILCTPRMMHVGYTGMFFRSVPGLRLLGTAITIITCLNTGAGINAFFYEYEKEVSSALYEYKDWL
jgi:hypothetical protein